MLYRILFVHLKFQCGSDTLFYMVAIQLPPRYTNIKKHTVLLDGLFYGQNQRQQEPCYRIYRL